MPSVLQTVQRHLAVHAATRPVSPEVEEGQPGQCGRLLEDGGHLFPGQVGAPHLLDIFIPKSVY